MNISLIRFVMCAYVVGNNAQPYQVWLDVKCMCVISTIIKMCQGDVCVLYSNTTTSVKSFVLHEGSMVGWRLDIRES
jgi:hypothetical protein